MISEKIFELILRNGMTQKEFSEETGISQSTISDWKRKGTNPSADKILKICEVLKVTPYELLGENETERNAGNPEMSAGNETEKIIRALKAILLRVVQLRNADINIAHTAVNGVLA